MPATSVTGIGSSLNTEGKGYSVIILVDEKAHHKMTDEVFRKADYVITKSGKYIKTRDGQHPVILNTPAEPKEKDKKYRSIDDA